MQVYTGKDAGSSQETNQHTRVILDLIEDIEKTGQNITCDDFFANLTLARKLLQTKLTLVGTMRKNKTELTGYLCMTHILCHTKLSYLCMTQNMCHTKITGKLWQQRNSTF